MTYRKALLSFEKFLMDYRLPTSVPVDPVHISQYLAHLHLSEREVPVLKGALSACLETQNVKSKRPY